MAQKARVVRDISKMTEREALIYCSEVKWVTTKDCAADCNVCEAITESINEMNDNDEIYEKKCDMCNGRGCDMDCVGGHRGLDPPPADEPLLARQPRNKLIVNKKEMPSPDSEKTKNIERAKQFEAKVRTEAKDNMKVRRVRHFDISGQRIRITSGETTISNFEYAELLEKANHYNEAVLSLRKMSATMKECDNMVDDMKNRLLAMSLTLDELEEETTES